MIDDDVARQEMGRAAAASMREEFEHGAQIARLESYYNELLVNWKKDHDGD